MPRTLRSFVPWFCRANVVPAPRQGNPNSDEAVRCVVGVPVACVVGVPAQVRPAPAPVPLPPERRRLSDLRDSHALACAKRDFYAGTVGNWDRPHLRDELRLLKTARKADAMDRAREKVLTLAVDRPRRFARNVAANEATIARLEQRMANKLAQLGRKADSLRVVPADPRTFNPLDLV
jgi:hypothetical protein